MPPGSGDDNKSGFRGPKSRADLLRKLASGDGDARRGHVITRNFMNSRGPAGMIEIVDTGLSPPVSPVDAVLYDVIKRLKRMRDIAETAAALPVNDCERARMQDEINQCRDEINDLSGLLSDAEKLEKKMSMDAPSTPAADLVGELLNGAFQEDIRDESPPPKTMDDEKISSWMKSVMRGRKTPEGREQQ